MSKLRCTCGHVIVDQTDHLSYKADLIPDKSFENFMNKAQDEIIKLLEVKDKAEEQEWIKNTFHITSYPTDLSKSDMVADILTKHYITYFKNMYQCEKCGRIHIQNGNTERFTSFFPENNDWKGILDNHIKEI